MSIKIFYWVSFALSVIIILLNFGLGLITTGIFILSILILHLIVGLSLNKIKNHNVLVAVSAINLLVFALIRPDGVHAFTDNGLSSVLELFGVYRGYDNIYEDYFFFVSLVLLLFQIIIDLRLRRISRANV